MQKKTPIQGEFSNRLLEVQRVESAFFASFGKAEDNITELLQELTAENFKEIHPMIESKIEPIITAQSLAYDNAMSFLMEVELRANGVIASPFFENILYYQFKDYPVREMLQEYKERFSTKNHPKSKGLHLQLEYPASWSAREGKRPNIIQLFRSYNGKGRVMANIMVRDAIKELAGILTPEDVLLLNTREGAKEMIAGITSESGVRDFANSTGVSDLHEIKVKNIIVDSWPGVMLEFIGNVSRIDVEMTMYTRAYIAAYKNYMIILMFQITKESFEPDEILQTSIKDYVPLFDLIANSLVIMSQY